MNSLWIYGKPRGAVVLILALLSSFDSLFLGRFASTLIDVRKSVGRKTWKVDVIVVDG
jgi:hypothetical protein